MDAILAEYMTVLRDRVNGKMKIIMLMIGVFLSVELNPVDVERGWVETDKHCMFSCPERWLDCEGLGSNVAFRVSESHSKSRF